MESQDFERRDERGYRALFRTIGWRRTDTSVNGEATADPFADDLRDLEPVHEQDSEAAAGRWTRRLVMFLRIMAALSMVKGLFHWAGICGVGATDEELFGSRSIAWQTATVFFAVIDLVAAVGLWLAAAWGAVIWLTAVASMVAVQLFFPQVFGRGFFTILFEGGLLAIYLYLALKAAREQPV